MKRTQIVLALLGASLLIPRIAAAEVEEGEAHLCKLCDAAESQPYFTQAVAKLGRGVVNGLLGWTELVAQPIRAHKAGESLIIGIDRGVGYTFKRTILGVGEFFTFWTWHETPMWAKDCALGEMGITGR